jgi:multiple sugar transport system substrate-binding protein
MSEDNHHDDSYWEEPVDRRTMLGRAAAAGGVLAAGSLLGGRVAPAFGAAAAAGNVTFFSTQLNTVNESEAFRSILLQGFDGKVDAVFAASDAVFVNRVSAEAKAGKGVVDVLGALHGTYSTLEDKNQLLDLSDIAKDFTKGKNAIPANLMKLGKLGTSKQLYMPWMQATYVMCANKKVLQYVPKGANVNRLTYGQLRTWAKTIEDKLGQGRLGFPAGANGLIHRFFQGYLVPAFSGGVVTTFKSPGAANGWQYLRGAWNYVHPQSLAYEFMQDPLLNEEVMLAWEHVARLTTALKTRPNDFVLFPSPTGPHGLAFMPVLAGLAVPKSSPNPAGAKALVRHLLKLSTQAKTLSAVGFFPVVQGRLSKSISAGQRNESNAVKLQQTSKKALPSLLPIGLGAEGGNFNKVYRDTFTRIVTKHEDVAGVLADEASQLQAIMDRSGAPCWSPDPPSTGACKVK